MPQIFYILISGHAEVTAADLSGALQKMSHNSPLAHQIIVIHGPVELVYQRPEKQRGIGAAACDDDICTVLKSLHDAGAAQIGVGGHFVLQIAKPLTSFKNGVVRVPVQTVKNVISQHTYNF